MKIAARFTAAPCRIVGDIPRIIRRRYTKALIGKLLEIERNTAAFKFSFRKIIAPGKKKRAREQQKTDFHDFPPNAYGFRGLSPLSYLNMFMYQARISLP